MSNTGRSRSNHVRALPARVAGGETDTARAGAAGGENVLPVRVAAVRVLARWLDDGAFPDRLLDDAGEERPVVREIVYGAVRRQRSLEWIVQRLASRTVDRGLWPFLLAGMYELFYMDTAADYAVVNEIIEGARRAHHSHSTGFLNAVLRRAAREREALRAALAAAPLAIAESYPDELAGRWTRRFGPELAAEICRAGNRRPRVCLRVRTAKIGTAQFLAALAAAGVPARPHPFRPAECVELERGANVAGLPGYAEGHFVVQDPATLAAIDLLDPQPGDHVLDACAAPGGKTIAIADRLAGRGEVVAADVVRMRLDRVRENIARTGVANCRVCMVDAADARALATMAGNRRFNRILLDVPCSNTGVLARRPDARWRFSEAAFRALVDRQRAMLDAAWPLLRRGGTLVYSTCSLEHEENAGLVDAWLAANPEAVKAGETLCLPPRTETDGAYAAALVKPRAERGGGEGGA